MGHLKYGATEPDWLGFDTPAPHTKPGADRSLSMNLVRPLSWTHAEASKLYTYHGAGRVA